MAVRKSRKRADLRFIHILKSVFTAVKWDAKF